MKLSKLRHITVGFVLGVALTLTTAVLANQSSTVQAWLTSNVSFFFNGVEKQLPANYTVLNYNGHTYVPARFIAEGLDAEVKWDEQQRAIWVTGKAVNETPVDQVDEEKEEPATDKEEGNKGNQENDEKDVSKYQKLPQLKYPDNTLVTVKSINFTNEYTAVNVELNNQGDIPMRLSQTTAQIIIDDKHYKQEDVRDKTLYPFDQTWFNDVGEDEKRDGLIKLPLIPEDTKYLTLEFEVVQNDMSQKATKLTFDIALD